MGWVEPIRSWSCIKKDDARSAGARKKGPSHRSKGRPLRFLPHVFPSRDPFASGFVCSLRNCCSKRNPRQPKTGSKQVLGIRSIAQGQWIAAVPTGASRRREPRFAAGLGSLLSSHTLQSQANFFISTRPLGRKETPSSSSSSRCSGQPGAILPEADTTRWQG